MFTFDAPGEGAWRLDTSHWSRPVSNLYACLYPPGIRAGSADSYAQMGAPMRHIDVAFIHGWAYGSQVVVSDDAELAARRAAAVAVWDAKPWRAELDRWDRETKPATRRRALELIRVPVDELGDAALADHLATCCDWLTAMVAQHHRYTWVWSLPVHDFTAAAVEWTGKDLSDVLLALEGCTAVSCGDDDVTAAAAAVVAGSPALRAIVERDEGDGDAAAVINELRARAAGAPAVLDWLDLCGARVVAGFDVAFPTTAEVPALLVAQLQRALDAAPPASSSGERREAAAAALRDAVPADERDAFDASLAEAQRQHRIRDERGVESDVTAAGVLRGALLAAGRRLSEQGRVEHEEDVLDATPAELVALVRGERQLAGELAARRERRAAAAQVTPPPALGDPPVPPPFAPEHERLGRALLSLWTGLYSTRPPSDGDEDEENGETGLLRGLGAYPGTYEGPVRLVVDHADLYDVEPGDVVVMVSATESVNVVLPIVGAIVTDQGGVASHAAIVARECGIPAVVGCVDATQRLNAGARVRVDGRAGEVRVLA